MRISSSNLVTLLGSWRSAAGLAEGLADRLAGLILDGRLPVGTRLPAERPLACDLQISRATVVGALAHLRDRGFLTTRHGSGTVVRLPPDATLESMAPWTAPITSERSRQEIDWSAAAPSAPPPEVHAAFHAALDRLAFAGTGYSAAGLAELRVAIAHLYSSRGLDTDADQICVTTGAQQAMNLVIRTSLNALDRVLIESPTYPGALDTFRARNARFEAVAVDGKWSLPALLAGLRNPRVSLAYLMPGLHNPTGLSMDATQREALRQATRTTGALILVDDTLTDLAPPSDGAILRFHRSARIVRIGSLSKTVWGGLRVGWARTDRATAHRLASEKSRSDLGTPMLEQIAAALLLKDYPALLKARRRHLSEAAHTLTASLASAAPSLQVSPDASGPSLWCRLPPDVTSSDLVATASRHGLRLVDAARFSPDRLVHRRLRLPVDIPPSMRPEAVHRLSRALEEVTTEKATRGSATRP
ncbi:PLP-dependent aminotransferase family protein [Nonomuraea sp. NPDC050202]|uniref:aminotransferase-like domain-containing protein n=1 Tax=Nonomuraea sp. NPDC050202 TaxID=3155035 RepID=UPI003403A9D3